MNNPSQHWRDMKDIFEKCKKKDPNLTEEQFRKAMEHLSQLGLIELAFPPSQDE